MKVFENINREYTPGINLDVLDKTYNTLEQGHKESVKAASELKTAIANMPMNEAEDGFKQQLLNEIQTTIDDNTIYGNSYGALDDIILSSGNIASDGRVIGRLRSQQSYLNYQNELNKSALPQHYKNYYKKVNTYYHNDKIDENGKVIGSTDWKPNEEYVDYIDVNAVMERAIKSVAAKKGSYSAPTIDAEGNITTNSRSWNTLSKSDIKKAIYNAFESTPGMKASLQQDYKIALDDLNDGVNNMVKDSAGNILTYDKYVDKIVDDFAETRDYNEVHSSSSYTPAKKDSNASKSGNNKTSGYGNSELLQFAKSQVGLNSHLQGTTDIIVNPIVNGEKRKIESGKSFTKIMNDAWRRNRKGLYVKSENIGDFVNYVRRKNPNVDIKGPVTAINTFFNSINPSTNKPYKDDYTIMEQHKLISLARTWGSQNYLDSQLNRDYTEEELDARNFRNSIETGIYNENNSSYDKAIIDGLNITFDGRRGIDKNESPIFKNAGNQISNIRNLKVRSYGSTGINNINITLSPEMFTKLSADYNNNTEHIFSTKRLNDGNYVISINTKNRNYLPELAYHIIAANNETTNWWNPKNWASFAATGEKHYQFEAYGDENKGDDLRYAISYLASIYENGFNSANKAAAKMNNVSTDRVTVSSTSYRTKSAAQNEWLVKNGLLESTEANRLDDRALSNVKSGLLSKSVSLGLVMEADENGVYTKSNNGLAIDEFLNKAYSSNISDETISWGEFIENDTKDGIPNTIEGYYLNIPVTKDIATDKYKEGDIVKLFVSGTIDEDINSGPVNVSEKLANDIVFATSKIKEPIMIMDPNPVFANTQIKNNKNGTYDIEFAGNTYQGNESVAKGFAKAMYEIQECKDIWDETENSYNVIMNRLTSPSININGGIYSISDVLAGITGTSNDTIDKLITNYIVYGNAE